MRHVFFKGLTTAMISVGLLGGVAAQTTHHRAHHHRSSLSYRIHDGRRLQAYAYGQADAQRRAGFENPAYGYEEAPYDPRYMGPGAQVFDATRRAAHEPGVTHELAPDAKETATGGPSGGIPGFDGT